MKQRNCGYVIFCESTGYFLGRDVSSGPYASGGYPFWSSELVSGTIFLSRDGAEAFVETVSRFVKKETVEIKPLWID